MPAACTVFKCVYACVRSRPRVFCGKWFRFIVYTVLIAKRMQYFYFSFIFHESKKKHLLSSKQKAKNTNQMKSHWTQRENDVKLFFIFPFVSFPIFECCVCINICHMRIIKWAHDFSVCSFVFSFIPATQSYQCVSQSIRFNERISFDRFA